MDHEEICKRTLLLTENYTPSEIEFMLSEFPDFPLSEFISAVGYSRIATERSRDFENVTYREPEIESLY